MWPGSPSPPHNLTEGNAMRDYGQSRLWKTERVQCGACWCGRGMPCVYPGTAIVRLIPHPPRFLRAQLKLGLDARHQLLRYLAPLSLLDLTAVAAEDLPQPSVLDRIARHGELTRELLIGMLLDQHFPAVPEPARSRKAS